MLCVKGGLEVGPGFQAEFGLHQNWMRHHDPTTGRYIQADPLGLVDGPSVYGYALQNPGRYVDPRGEQSIAAEGPMSMPGSGSLGNLLNGAGRIARVCATAGGAFVTFVFYPSSLSDGTCPAHGCGIVFSEEDPEILPAEDSNNNGTASKPSFTGKPGTVQTGDYQDRLYGPDGKPKTDIDWDANHEGLGRPHAHDWGPNGERIGRKPTDAELNWSGGRRDPGTGKLGK